MKQEKFWKIRSEKYNELKWVNDSSYKSAIISSTDFCEKDLVLDVGTGTGVMAHTLAPLVNEIIGLDISQDMLQHSNWKDNKYFIKRDIRDPIFCDCVFDKIVARMVFHHITENTQEAMDECYRILKYGGKMILAEGIPPKPEIKEDYATIFQLKEKRLVFLKQDLVNLMKKSGFQTIKTVEYIMKGFSINNWLRNSGLPEEKSNKIYELHVNASDEFKEAYNMKITEKDCLIDVKNLIIVGEK
ncbi:methyltransferase domain-containing protein [Candidatus Woesearchaeota archaeon]|nr:methyltransferase domain-containing protein [Candidatus Woesearchaeota archaeon]